MAMAKNVNNNDYIKNFTSDKMADDDPASEACLQNNYNTNQLNNGQIARNRSMSLLSAGSKKKGITIIGVGVVLLAGIVAVCASFVMLGMLSLQKAKIRSLESELETLKAENVLCNNETASLSLQLTACEKELQTAVHQIEINSAQCELEKGNISAKLAAEILKGEHEKEMAQQRLNVCEGNKEALSQRIEAQARNAEAEKREIRDKLDGCEQEKREMARRRDEEVRQWEAERMAASPAKASSANEGGSSWWSPSRSNGPERIESVRAVVFLSTMLLPLLVKVLQVV